MQVQCIQIGCVWATPICFGNQTIGSGCNVIGWEQALQGKGRIALKQWWLRAHIRSWWSGRGDYGTVPLKKRQAKDHVVVTSGDHEWLKPVEPGQKLVCEGSCYPRGRTCMCIRGLWAGLVRSSGREQNWLACHGLGGQ